jgi:uncharacterized integral membrane protein (TIGR00697 family)
MLNPQLGIIERTGISNNSIQFKYFFMILALFTATWLSSDITAIKLVSVFGITLTGGFIVFPFTTLLGTVIVEVYGYKNARQAIWSGLIINSVFVFFVNIVYFIPSSPSWMLNNQYKNILIPETRIIAASLISFLFSEFINSYLMAKMKINSQGQSLIRRVLISSGFAFFFDVTCFLILAFYGTMPDSILSKLIFYAYFKKVLCQILFLPVIFGLSAWLKKLEGIDICDYDTSFNPFSLDNLYQVSSLAKHKLQKKSSFLQNESSEPC